MTETAGEAAPPAGEPEVSGDREGAGLAYVATVSFLASRAAPSAGFFVALAGGASIARAAGRLGARRGAGASIAAVIESVAILGPARFNVPVTQAISAPILGRLFARGAPLALIYLVCLAIRILHNAVTTAFIIWVLLGGLDAYAGSYDAIFARLLNLPAGEGPALIATAVALVVWGGFASFVQVFVYRRALSHWPDPEAAPGGPDQQAPEEARAGSHFDPRFAALAAVIAFALLLASTEWILLGAVVGWLALASLGVRADRSVVVTGLALGGVLAGGVLFAGLIGGVGADAALRRSLRAALLVAVATWLRAVAGPGGVREVARRSLARLRRVPGVPEASSVLDRLGSDRSLAEAGRSLIDTIGPAEKRPLPLVDAVLGWAVAQAKGHVPPTAAPPPALTARALDAALVAAAMAPFAAILLG